MSSLLKFTYNSEAKKINGYLKTSVPDFLDVKEKIHTNLFVEHQQKPCEIRFYWIDEDSDEIDIVTQIDYDIFLEKSVDRRHLLVAPKQAPSGKEASSAKAQDAPSSSGFGMGQTQEPPSSGEDLNNPRSIHLNVNCDSCLMAPIVGFRYKCIQCPNYDLCQHCEAKHVHADHMMVRMPNNNCPYVVDAWVSGGGLGCGRKSGRKHHEKRFKSGGAMPTPFGFNFAMPTATVATAEGEKPKECGGSGRKHARRSARHSFLSHLYEMMNDLAEGGGAAAAEAAMGTDANNAANASDTKTTTSTTTTTTSDGAGANVDPIAKSAMEAAQKAHEAAVSAAEIAAKVAHQTAVEAAKKATMADTATTSASAAAASAASQTNQETQKTTTTATTTSTPNSSQTTPTMSATPSLQDFVQLLDPKLLRGGMEILNNFNDMFAKMLDPVEGDDTSSACPIADNIRRASQQSSNSNKSMQTNASNMSNSESKAEEKKTSNLLEISDVGSDSESDSVSESFIKLNAPTKENTPEKATPATANNKSTTPSTPNTSQTSTPPQSLNKSNIMDFAQLSADLKAHIAQEQSRENTTPVKPAQEAAVELRAVPVFNTPPKTPEGTDAGQPRKPEENPRAVHIYHEDELINHSIRAMMSMGFSNEGAWLTQLLESVNGNISEALDLISATQRNSR
ncbi:protein ref(2)P [Stomoxys calcitrans]|uniref:protein ref(2)P n=1 Tax=Stomoxys calcitrans TaxID=35570 RepID=UPI0027E31FC2|nr:protein ref(2)P [Stomoxys calcitrans]